MGDVAALGSTIAIVSHVHADSVQLVLFTFIISTNLTLELSNFIDVGNTQSRSQLSISLVNTTTVTVTSQDHGVVHIGSDVQIRLTGTTEVLTSLAQSSNHSLSIDEALAEILPSVGALKLISHSSKVDILMDCVQLVVSPDRTDLVREDLLGVAVRTIVTQHSSNSQSLLKRNLVDAILELNIIEIFDVSNIVTMQFRSHIDSLRIGSTSYQSIVTSKLLLGALLITLSLESIDIADINMGSTDTAVRDLLSLSHDSVNPAHIVSDELRSAAGMSFHIVGEHSGDITITSLNKAANISVFKFVLLSIDFHSGLERTNVGRLSQLQNLTLSRMRQNVLIFLLIVIVKYIMFHFFFLLIVIVVFIIGSIFKCLTDKCIDYGFLFFSKSVENFGNSFFAFFVFIFRFFSFLCHFVISFGFFVIIRMVKTNGFTSVDDCFLIGLFTVFNNRVDECTGVCPSKYKTYFTNCSVNYIGSLLFKLVCINGQRRYVAMLNQKFSSSTRLGFIKGAICIYTFVTILQQSMSENFVGIVVLVIPNQRNRTTIIMFESISTNNSSVRALQIITSSPATKIKLRHFDFLLLLLIFRQLRNGNLYEYDIYPISN